MNDENTNTQAEENEAINDEQLEEVAGGARMPRRFLSPRLRRIGSDDGEGTDDRDDDSE